MTRVPYKTYTERPPVPVPAPVYVWATNGPLSRGIEQRVLIHVSKGGWAVVQGRTGTGMHENVGKGNWHHTRKDAVAKQRDRIARAIKNHREKIAELIDIGKEL